MFKYYKTEIEGKEYLIKDNDGKEILAVNNDGKFMTTINSVKALNIKEEKELAKNDIQKLGLQPAKNSPIKIINSEHLIDTKFLLDENTFVQNIDIAIKLSNYANDRKIGCVIFDEKKAFFNEFKKERIEYAFYNELNLKIAFSDLDEKILLETMSLSANEKSVVSTFLEFREANKENAEFGLSVLDGSNWMEDIFHTSATTLSQQFNIPEHKIRLIKTKLIQLKKMSIFDDSRSSVKEILQKVYKGETVIIDLNAEQKKILKLALNLNATTPINVFDNTYNEGDKLIQCLFNKRLAPELAPEFKNLLVNKYGFNLRNELPDIQVYSEELLQLSFEYILITDNSFPVIVTGEKYKKNNTIKEIKVSNSSTQGFF